MQQQTFYRLIFIGVLIFSVVIWQLFFPLIAPYPDLTIEAPELPEIPNLRDPRDWEKLQEYIPLTIEPIWIFIIDFRVRSDHFNNCLILPQKRRNLIYFYFS
jgi:hypothetical protein